MATDSTGIRTGMTAEPETQHTSAAAERKRLHRINLAAGIGFPAAIFCALAVFGLTYPLILPAFFAALLLVPLAFKLYVRTGKCRLLLRIIRAVSAGLLVFITLPAVICLLFPHTPLMYPVRRSIFMNGVRHSGLIETYLPETLPAQHDDYYFCTNPFHLSLDEIPFVFLFLHTDEEVLRSYEAALSSDPQMTRLENAQFSAESLITLWERNLIDYGIPAENRYEPRFIDNMLNAANGAGCQDDLSSAVVFLADNKEAFRSGSGALINYETGLLILWL